MMPADTKAMVANPSKCRPTRLFDILMPLALPLRNHPECIPLFPGNAYSTRPSDKPPLKNTSKRNWGQIAQTPKSSLSNHNS
jgi:hypothetical protein